MDIKTDKVFSISPYEHIFSVLGYKITKNENDKDGLPPCLFPRLDKLNYKEYDIATAITGMGGSCVLYAKEQPMDINTELYKLMTQRSNPANIENYILSDNLASISPAYRWFDDNETAKAPFQESCFGKDYYDISQKLNSNRMLFFKSYVSYKKDEYQGVSSFGDVKKEDNKLRNFYENNGINCFWGVNSVEFSDVTGMGIRAWLMNFYITAKEWPSKPFINVVTPQTFSKQRILNLLKYNDLIANSYKRPSRPVIPINSSDKELETNKQFYLTRTTMPSKIANNLKFLDTPYLKKDYIFTNPLSKTASFGTCSPYLDLLMAATYDTYNMFTITCTATSLSTPDAYRSVLGICFDDPVNYLRDVANYRIAYPDCPRMIRHSNQTPTMYNIEALRQYGKEWEEFFNGYLGEQAAIYGKTIEDFSKVNRGYFSINGNDVNDYIDPVIAFYTPHPKDCIYDFNKEEDLKRFSRELKCYGDIEDNINEEEAKTEKFSPGVPGFVIAEIPEGGLFDDEIPHVLQNAGFFASRGASSNLNAIENNAMSKPQYIALPFFFARWCILYRKLIKRLEIKCIVHFTKRNMIRPLKTHYSSASLSVMPAFGFFGYDPFTCLYDRMFSLLYHDMILRVINKKMGNRDVNSKDGFRIIVNHKAREFLIFSNKNDFGNTKLDLAHFFYDYNGEDAREVIYVPIVPNNPNVSSNNGFDLFSDSEINDNPETISMQKATEKVNMLELCLEKSVKVYTDKFVPKMASDYWANLHRIDKSAKQALSLALDEENPDNIWNLLKTGVSADHILEKGIERVDT